MEEVGTRQKAFVSYINDDGEQVDGMFEVILSDSKVTLYTAKNTLHIPWHRINKVKEVQE
jgi:hypothetical protein